MSSPPLPSGYVDRMTALLGNDAEAFFASYEHPARPGLRVNPARISADEFIHRAPWPLEPVPWCPDGFYLPPDVPAGKHPWHAAGVYYLQEPSAMAPVGQMALEPDLRVADLCAAPGGKATQIQAGLAATGVLVANEVVGSRIKPLGENLERWGANQAIITNLELARLAAQAPGRFDRVLVDAPCSGEGLFRRSPDARAEWSMAHVEGSARRQRSILDAAARTVRPGGRLVYSTCTFAPEENEQVIAAFLDTHTGWSLEPIRAIPGAAPGRSDWAATAHDLSGMARLWPHRLEGDGHTIARLRRAEEDAAGELPTSPRPPSLPTREAQQALDEFLESFLPGVALEGVLTQQRDALFLAPAAGDCLGALPAVRNGVWLGTVSGRRFTPSHALALVLRPDQCALVEHLDFEEAARYLSGETLAKPGPTGWVLLALDGFSLGWGKRSGNVVKNHYPKGLRRPVASWMSAA